MAKYIIGDYIFDTCKAKQIIQYEKYEEFMGIPTTTLYRTIKGKWIEVKKFYHLDDVRVFVRDDKYVRNLLKELNAIKIYEEYFGKLEEI